MSSEQVPGASFGHKIMRRKTAPNPTPLTSSNGYPKQTSTASTWKPTPAPSTPKQPSYRSSAYSPPGSSGSLASPPRKKQRMSVDTHSYDINAAVHSNGLPPRKPQQDPRYKVKDNVQAPPDAPSESSPYRPQKREDSVLKDANGDRNGKSSSVSAGGLYTKDTNRSGGQDTKQPALNGLNKGSPGRRANHDLSLNKGVNVWWDEKYRRIRQRQTGQPKPEQTFQAGAPAPSVTNGFSHRGEVHSPAASRYADVAQKSQSKPASPAPKPSQKKVLSPKKELRKTAEPEEKIIQKPPAEERRERLAARLDSSGLDNLIYGQEGASEPPPGVAPDRHPPGPRDPPLFAHIDPRVAWKRQHSAQWWEKKKQEDAARGTRKENFGKAAQRMAARRLEEGPVPLEETLPPRVRENEGWVRAMHWFAECDKKDLERYREAKRQEQTEK
ncbi:hypothetical protein NKR23_g1264 [Pleurostoma richardsiae]|uniref:Uncharacterized protein n=1 Tax=Pleurostoma richardsiae TaxID=41990 RepID=A0AA38RTR3_9PEZI|nr:hypothetical protein NKR23_g1264 [Pleurostoma richardsiae]